MQNFENTPDFFQAAPPDWYLSRCITAEPHIREGKASMIHLEWEIIDTRFAGQRAHHYITTDGNVKGGAAIFAKQYLRGLGVDFKVTPTIVDAELCQALLGREYFVKYANDRQMSEDSSGKYTIPVTALDYDTGKEVELKKLVVTGYMSQGLFAKRPAGNGAQTGKSVSGSTGAQGATASGSPVQGSTGALPSNPAGYPTLGGAPAGQQAISPAVAAAAVAGAPANGRPPFLRD